MKPNIVAHLLGHALLENITEDIQEGNLKNAVKHTTELLKILTVADKNQPLKGAD